MEDPLPSLGWSTDAKGNTLLVYEDTLLLAWRLGECDDFADAAVPARRL